MPGGRLTQQERQQDRALGWADNLPYAEIARRLDRPTSTITREVMRNGGPRRLPRRPWPTAQLNAVLTGAGRPPPEGRKSVPPATRTRRPSRRRVRGDADHRPHGFRGLPKMTGPLC